jgi:hypothetical protein
VYSDKLKIKYCGIFFSFALSTDYYGLGVNINNLNFHHHLYEVLETEWAPGVVPREVY